MRGGCVSEADLRALVLGELPDELATEVEEHLLSCPGCESAARRIDISTDPFLRSLRRAYSVEVPGDKGRTAAEPGGEKDAAGDLPARVASYEVLAELGRGGMGVVYKASQERPRRIVALKMILAGTHAGTDRRARLLAEADAIARLQHPHIVQIYEVGEHERLPFLALEYMPGGSLADRLDGLPQPPERAASLAEMLARAVDHAHAAGVIHRDLKPSNVLLADDGTPKVSDFGLAKRGDVDLTATGAVLGTPSYMAPEQAAGSRVVGPAADVYAVGAILYELLTGRPPFRAATPLETLDQVRTQEPVPVRQLQHRVPRDLETVCLKCLEKDPAKRYPGAGELADDLRRFLDDRPVRARRVSAWGRLRRWVHREPALAGMSAAVALLLLTLLAGTLAANWRLNRTAREATDRLFEALLTRVEAGRGSGRPGQRFAGKEAIRQAADIARAQGRPAEDFLRLRNEAIACLALPDLALEQQWDGNPPGTVSLGFDPRFQRYAWGRKDEPLSLRRLQDHGELFRLPVLPSDRVSRWARSKFSPDGRYLAVFYRQWSEKRPVEVWDLEGGRQRPTVVLHDVATVPDFAADGRALAARLADGTVVLIDLPSGHERRRFRPGAPSDALALHRDGRLVAVSSSAPDRVQVCDLTTGAVTREMPHSAKVVAVAWTPDGRLLASSCNDQQVHLWDGLTGQKRGVLTGHRWGPEDLAFDPSGRWLASFGWDMTLRVWDPGTQRQLLDLEEIRVVSFRTRGGLAAAGVTGRQACVWAFRPSEVYDELSFPATEVMNYDFSPDGRRVAAVGPGAGLRVWDVRDRSEVCSVPEMSSVAWGPDWSWYLTTGENGYSRGAVHVLPGEAGAPDHLRLEPPELLDGVREDTRGELLTRAAPGHRLFAARLSGPRIKVFDVVPGGIKPLWEAPMVNVGFRAASPDGRLVALGSFEGGSGVQIREADTGRLLQELAIGDATLAFSRDGRRLFTTTGRISPRGAECCAWRPGSDVPELSLPLSRPTSSPATFAVAPDGTLAVAYTMNDVRLLDADTFRELATLQSPDPRLIAGLQFSPDGTHLAAFSTGNIHLWDLRRLREELAGLGLDWDRPPYPPETARPTHEE
jgi:WD40 repeat protein/tRNA A-37 threonylcarbamoyl transferase component Bud32